MTKYLLLPLLFFIFPPAHSQKKISWEVENMVFFTWLTNGNMEADINFINPAIGLQINKSRYRFGFAFPSVFNNYAGYLNYGLFGGYDRVLAYSKRLSWQVGSQLNYFNGAFPYWRSRNSDMFCPVCLFSANEFVASITTGLRILLSRRLYFSLSLGGAYKSVLTSRFVKQNDAVTFNVNFGFGYIFARKERK